MTAHSTVLLLGALLAFQVKHLICDFVLQTRFQVENKGFYGHAGGLVHAGCHALFSVPVLLILTRSPFLIGTAIVGEFLIHYHTDWLKARIERVRGWNQRMKVYWIAFGIDQFVHQATYIAMVAWVLDYSPA